MAHRVAEKRYFAGVTSPAVAAAIALVLASRGGDGEFRARQRIAIGDITFARFLQVHEGVPVLDRGVAIVVDASGTTLHSSADVARDFPSAQPTIDAARAAHILASSPASHVLVYVALPGRTRLAWRFRIRVPEFSPVRPVVLVDAHDGSLLRIEDEARDASTLAYDDNPIATPRLEKVALSLLPDGAKSLTSPELEARSCIDHGRVKTFDGKSVHVCDVEASALADSSGDFLISPPDDPAAQSTFAETQAFFHAAKIARYVRDDLGVDVMPSGMPLRLITNLRWPPGWTANDASKIACGTCPLEPIPNAFFAPGEAGGPGAIETLFETRGDAIWFGLGPHRNWSVDGSVVHHEYTHAIVQRTIAFASAPRVDAQGVSFSPGAMNEGVADYFAAAMVKSPRLGEWVSGDLDPPRDVLRDLSTDARCPSSLVGEVHFDSLMFSSALHRVRSTLADDEARRALDRALLATLAAGRSGDFSFDEFATLMITTTRKVASTTLADALASEFARRGLLPGCERVIDLASSSPVHAASPFGWIAPGRAVVGVKGTVPPVIQFRRTLDPNATHAKIRFVLPTQFKKSVDLTPPSGRAFSPKLFARFDSKIAYLPSAARAPGATEVPLTRVGDEFHGELAIGPGARTLQIAIESDGDLDGNYDFVSIATESPTPFVVGGGGCAYGTEPPERGTLDVAWWTILALTTSRAFRSRRSRR